VVALVLLSGCGVTNKSNDISPTEILELVNPTNVSENNPPTEIPIPAVVYIAFINQVGIPLSSFQASFIQFNLAFAEFPDLLSENETAEEKVITDLLYRQILAQAANDSGFEVTPEMLLEKLNSITEEVGGEEPLLQWIHDNGYTSKAEFLYDLSVEIAATFQRNRIYDSVPLETQQTLAHQLFFHDAYLASRAYDQLSSGAAWDVIQNSNDPYDYGYLGWFPRGYLLVPEIEEVAFSLLPGAFSEVIESEIGYHIIYVLDRGDKILLSPDALLGLKNIALSNWLDKEYQISEIEIYLPQN